jgi:hypothetical protein
MHIVGCGFCAVVGYAVKILEGSDFITFF